MTDEAQTMRHALVPRIFRSGEGYGVPFVAGLDVGLGVAGLDRQVQAADLASWDLSFELALASAIANLRTITQPGQLTPIDRVDGLFAFATSNGTAAARALVLPELLPSWPADGVLVASPTSNQLLVVPLDGPHALGAFRAILMATEATRALALPLLSDQLFWTDGLQWQHIRLTHKSDTVEVDPPPGFIALFERLAGYSLVSPEPIEA